MNESTPVHALIGRNLRAWRSAHTCTQEELSLRMRTVGITWRQPMVALVERGQRDVSVAELLALCIVTGLAPDRLLQPDKEETVMLGDRPYPGDRIQELATGEHPRWPEIEEHLRIWRGDDVERRALLEDSVSIEAKAAAARWIPAERLTVEMLQRLDEDAAAGAEVSLSRSFRRDGADPRFRHLSRIQLRPWDVTAISYALWGHSLTAERERRLSATGRSNPTSDRAQRGHITRDLRTEILDYASQSAGRT